MLAFAPSLSPSLWRPNASGIATPSLAAHLQQVVAPLLLGALASGRVPALPYGAISTDLASTRPDRLDRLVLSPLTMVSR